MKRCNPAYYHLQTPTHPPTHTHTHTHPPHTHKTPTHLGRRGGEDLVLLHDHGQDQRGDVQGEAVCIKASNDRALGKEIGGEIRRRIGERDEEEEEEFGRGKGRRKWTAGEA
jgi:hypothetical protein